MDRSVTQIRNHLAQVELENALRAATRYAAHSRSANTWRAYKSDWRIFEDWCRSVNLASLPAEPETVAMFVAAQADQGLSPSTLRRRLAAIQLVHFGAGHPSPHRAKQVNEVMRGIARNWGKPVEKKAPLLNDDIKRLADAVEPETAKGLRDRALLLFGFAGAFRRSELVGLDVANLDRRDEGLLVTIEKSKTDQEAVGQVIAIPARPESPYCPVQALDDWLTVAEITSGALFRRMFRGDVVGRQRLSAQSVALVVKEYAGRVGLDYAQFSGHSLRSGFITSAAQKDANIFKMAEHSRHKSFDVLRDYVQNERKFEDHAGTRLLDDLINVFDDDRPAEDDNG